MHSIVVSGVYAASDPSHYQTTLYGIYTWDPGVGSAWGNIGVNEGAAGRPVGAAGILAQRLAHIGDQCEAARTSPPSRAAAGEIAAGKPAFFPPVRG
jgi:hypothetical protein